MAILPYLSAQSASTNPTAPASSPAAAPTSNAASSLAGDQGDQQVVKLPPFSVSATAGTESYQVQDTLAGTRVRTKLSDLGSAITVVSQFLMSNLQANNAMSLLQYTPNTEVGGMYGNFAGLGNTSTLSEDQRLLQPNTDTRVRGLASADNTRNYFLTSIPWDNFDIDRIDMQRGPNSMLFGVGSPAGIINASLNDAIYRNQGKVEDRIGKYGSLRNSVDFNQVILPNQLAVRFAALDDNEQYQQHFTFNHQKRVYFAARYDPKWMQFPGATTSFKVNDEYGTVSANNPRELPPVDNITPWFYTGTNGLNKLTVNPYAAGQTGGPVNSNGGNPWINNGSVMGREYWSNVRFAYTNPGSVAPSYIREAYDIGTPYGIGHVNPSSGGLPTQTTWPITGAIQSLPFGDSVSVGSYSSYALKAGLPGSQYGAYRDKYLTNPSIFDFYNYTLDGPNSHEWQRWNGLNLEFTQTALDNRLGLDAAYYNERYLSAGENYLTGGSYAISIDMNSILPDGSPNPNVGRPFIGTDGAYGNSETMNNRSSWRAELYGDLRSKDFLKSHLLQEILGHHRLTALYSRSRLDTTSMGWARWNTTMNWLNAVGGSQQISGGSRNVDLISYLGPSLLNATSAAGAHLTGLSSIHAPTSAPTVTYFDSHWKYPLNPTDPSFVDPNAAYTLPADTVGVGQTPQAGNQSENYANYNGWTTGTFNILNADNGQRNQLYFQGDKHSTIVKSFALTWQAYMFNDKLVPSFGWRSDRVSLAASSAPYRDISQSLVDPFNYNSGPVQAVDQEDSRTWSVVLHAPDAVKRFLPKGTDISVFYDSSQNFQAQTIRKDFFGNTIPDATGKTKEYGFVLSALDNRVSLKVDWYDTKVKNADLTGNQLGSNAYILYLLPTWAAAHAEILYAGLTNQDINGVSVQSEPWFWDYSNYYDGTPYGAQPRGPAEAAGDAAEMASIKAFADNSLPQSFYNAYEMPVNVAAMKAGDWLNVITQPNWNPITQGAGALQSGTGGTIGGIAPSATVDTVSKGIEFELYARLTPNWNITINAAKTSATRENLNKTLVQVITDEQKLWNSAAGDLHLWWAGGTPMKTVFDQNIYGPYQNLLAQAGTQAAEIRPWHVNAITNYAFTHGRLKGVNVGLAYRWEQGEILGYALNPTTQIVDANKPFKGPSDSYVDLWIGYTRKLTDKITWHCQLNLHNVGQNARLIPIAVEPNGSPAEFRILDGQYWQFTNTFSF